MNNKETQAIEAEILGILQRSGKDYLTASQITGSLSSDLKRRIGLSGKPNKATVLKQLKPYLGERLKIYKNARYTYIGKSIPLTEIVFNYINMNPNLSPRQAAQKLPAVKSEVVEALNQLIEAGNILSTFKNTPDCTPSLKTARAYYLPPSDDPSVFKAAYEAVGGGKSFVRIHRVRDYLNWPRERFDAVLKDLMSNDTIELHGGDPSIMSEKEIRGSYMDENNILYLTLTWEHP